MTAPTHFEDEGTWADGSGLTLCGKRFTTSVWGNDPKARCKRCCDEWHKAGWRFPLPETVH
jgi:hypothetical protein